MKDKIYNSASAVPKYYTNSKSHREIKEYSCIRQHYILIDFMTDPFIEVHCELFRTTKLILVVYFRCLLNHALLQLVLV